LDLRVFPDWGHKILDKNEYKYHKKIMNYSEDLDLVINKELEKLIQIKQKKDGPFNIRVVNEYLEKFEKIKNSK